MFVNKLSSEAYGTNPDEFSKIHRGFRNSILLPY